ncbi:MAG: Glyoxalase/bleomycin resistance protein/dioxygenase [Caulobacter sp.]|jgi:catechol 2,3-dioxygenase-like lactoylglutathione lyase family enzyme|nr:Glyoxalase/bleomycin resistance protein/dioxygenase [Caulobacter sp.]
MLKDRSSSAILAVSDLARARDFYERTLGFEAEDAQEDEVVSYRSGETRFTVYRSEFAGSNKANAITFQMDGDLEAVVADLKAKGVRFEHYDLPGLTLDGDIHRAGGAGLVWFKDPDGNILHLIDGM